MSHVNTQRRNLPTPPVASLSGWQRLWLPSVRGPYAILETILGMVAIVALCSWLHPEDPLLLQSGFPWLALFALIFALRYGALIGALAGACLLLAWWGLYGTGGVFPKSHFVGVFALLVLAGHFSDLWSARLHQETSTQRYLNSRLVSLTNSHYLLRVSHDRLEKELLSRPTTVRDSIAHLRDSIRSGDTHALPQAQALMDYLATACQINEAALFPAEGRGFATQAIAQVGDPTPLNLQDPLLRRCLETAQLSHIRETTEGEESDYLVCAPLRTAQGQTLGLLAVRRMRFMALNHDNLQLILVMLAYYADCIHQQPAIEAVRRRVPECPEAFALEAARLSHLAADGGPGSFLVALTFQKDGVHQAAFSQLSRQRRALDLSWEYETQDALALVILLALTDKEGVDGYVARVEALLQTQFDLDFQKARIGIYSQALGSQAPGRSLRTFVDTWSTP